MSPPGDAAPPPAHLARAGEVPRAQQRVDPQQHVLIHLAPRHASQLARSAEIIIKTGLDAVSTVVLPNDAAKLGAKCTI